MLDLPQLLDDEKQYLDKFIKLQENTLKGLIKKKSMLDKSNMDYIFDNNLHFDSDDLKVLIKRTESRVRGAKKMNFDLKENPNKASTYKIYLLSSLASKEHWYKTDVDSEVVGLEIKGYLNGIKNLMESKPPKPDDQSWNNIRKEYPSMLYNTVEFVEKIKNKMDYLLDITLGGKSKTYWELCRVFELYDTVPFKNDNDPMSEPIKPQTPLHPTDSFIRFEIDPDDFQDKKRHRFILLDEMSDIRIEARLYNDFFENKKKLKKIKQNKP